MLQADPALARKSMAGLPLGYRLARSLQSHLFCKSPAEVTEERERVKSVIRALDHQEYDPLDALTVIDNNGVSFPWLFHGRSDRELLEPFARVFERRIIGAVAPELLEPMGPRKPGKLRVGYASPQLRRTNASRWALKWVRSHPREEMEIYAFDIGPMQDALTDEWKQSVDEFYRLTGSPLKVAALIRDLDLDVLMFTDVGIDGSSYVLASMRLARRQCAAWGGPSTTGLANVDYYIAGELMLDEHAEEEFTEKLVRLPGTGVDYERRFVPVPVQRERKMPFEPFMNCTQTLYKCHPDWDFMLADLSNRLQLPIAFTQCQYDVDQLRYAERFKASGVNFYFYPRLIEEGYAQILQKSALSIDTPYYNGGVTAIDALALGTPILTLPTPSIRGRFGKAFMERIGMGHWVAKDPVDYVEKALAWKDIRADMAKADTDVLFEDERITPALNAWLLNGELPPG